MKPNRTATIDTILGNTPRTPSVRVAEVAMALAETIRTAGSGGVPAGHLYAALIPLSPDDFTLAVDIIVGAKLVERRGGHVLAWCGPVVAESTDQP